MSVLLGGGRWIRPPAGGPGRGENMPLACFLTPLPSNPSKHENKDPTALVVSLFWWGKVDSNHRRHCQQIYSLSPLATREFPHIHFSPRYSPGRDRRSVSRRWSWWTDSNPRPADYKSAALPTELHQHRTGLLIIANRISNVKFNFYFFSIFSVLEFSVGIEKATSI